jgi:hypothetical protein
MPWALQQIVFIEQPGGPFIRQGNHHYPENQKNSVHFFLLCGKAGTADRQASRWQAVPAGLLVFVVSGFQ